MRSRSRLAMYPIASTSLLRYKSMPSASLRRAPASTFSRIAFKRLSSIVTGIGIVQKKDVGSPEAEKQDAHPTVHREEGRVYTTQVVRLDERVLIGEQAGDCEHAHKAQGAQM